MCAFSEPSDRPAHGLLRSWIEPSHNVFPLHLPRRLLPERTPLPTRLTVSEPAGCLTSGARGYTLRQTMELDISTADLGDGVATIAVAGEVDLYTAPALKQAISTVIDQGARSVLVDLSRTTFIDSTTLGVLMGAVKRLRPGGGELAITCYDPNIRKIFEITLLDRVFNIFDSTDAGIAHLRELAGRPAPSVSPRG